MTRVIKVGGRVQQDPCLASAIADQWQFGAHPLVIVHGGGDTVTELQKAFGIEAQFVGGRRLTSARDMDLVRMALSGLANKQLVAMLTAASVAAVGISGEDDGLIGAVPMDAERLGYVGEVSTVRPGILLSLISTGRLPVVSPVSRNVSETLGPALNVNGDDAAAVIAIAVAASELLLISDVPGVLVDGAVMTSLSASDARALIADGTAAKGMAAKLEAAIVALEGGVPVVRIGDISMMSGATTGTSVSLTPAVPAQGSARAAVSDQSVAVNGAMQ